MPTKGYRTIEERDRQLARTDTLPLAKLSAINSDSLFHASYMGECVTLSPEMTLEEFRSQIVKLEALKERVATERAKREASRI